MKNEEKLFRIKRDFINVLKHNQSIPLFIDDDLNMSCYENYVQTTKKFTDVIKKITNATDIEELIDNIKKSQNNQEVVKIMINNTYLLNEIWYLNRYKHYKNEDMILFNWIENYCETQKVKNFDIQIISKKIFDRLYIIKNKYGFSNIQINFDFNKYSESFCSMLETQCIRLCHYLGLKEQQYNKIGEGLILNLSSYDKLSPNKELGQFKYSYANTGNIIVDSVLTLNYYKNRTSKNQLFRTLLHEYIHFMDYKLGNIIIKRIDKNSTKNSRKLYSEMETKNKKILSYINENMSFIINENLNNSNIIKNIDLIKNKDKEFLLKILTNLCHTKSHEQFCIENKEYFHNFLNYIAKITEKADTLNSIQIKSFVDGYKSHYEYFLDSINVIKKNKHKLKCFLKKHVFLKNLIIYFDKNIDFIPLFLNELDLFKKYGYIKKRAAYHDAKLNLTFTEPKLFKKNIILFENRDYFSKPCETLTWSLTRGIVYKKKINKNFINWMFNTLEQDFINIKYRPLKLDKGKQNNFIEAYLENAPMILSSIYLHFYFKFRLNLK